MKLVPYLKDKILEIIIYVLVVILNSLVLNAFQVNIGIIIYLDVIYIIYCIFVLIYNYYKKNKYYKILLSNLKNLDKKYYILETMPDTKTYEQSIMVNSLYEINKSMIDTINEKENSIKDYKEFVELWIHEVKIPISSLVLKCHNNKDKYSKDFINELSKLDNYIDEVLYYLRSECTEKDFFINECNIKDIVKNVAIKNQSNILDNNIELSINVDNLNIETDSKWMEFILNQIINNSIKYKRGRKPQIEITLCKKDNNIILSIKDNGIGIPDEDLPRVFDKSFTGTNGRNKVKSTGMGLYIAKNLCNKLGHKIEIDSKVNEYTKVDIIFSKNDYYKM